MKKLLTLFACLLLFTATAESKTIRTATGRWKLVWQDNFNGKKFNPAVWSKITRGKSEWQKYMTNYAPCYDTRGGKMILRGIVNDCQQQDTAHYLTGGIYTVHKKYFHRGRLEIRLKMQNARGAWPAVWLLPDDKWPYGGEIDIMEHLNDDSIAYQTVHSPFTLYANHPHKPRSSATAPIRVDDFNTYGVELYQDSLTFFINDHYSMTYRRDASLGPDQYPFDRPMYLLIDMQLGGDWVGKVHPEDLPYDYIIDSVKYYQKVE